MKYTITYYDNDTLCNGWVGAFYLNLHYSPPRLEGFNYSFLTAIGLKPKTIRDTYLLYQCRYIINNIKHHYPNRFSNFSINHVYE